MSILRPERRSDHPTSSLTELMRRRLPPQGYPATREQALTHSAVYECVDLIADLISGFPVGRFRTEGDARVASTSRAPAVDNPSIEDDPVNWRRIVVAGWLLKGFSAGIVSGTSNGYPSGIELIEHHRVDVKRSRPDAPWVWLLDGDVVERYPSGPLWIAPGKKLWPGDPLGRSVLEFAMIEVGMGLAARKFGGDFFQSNGHPTAVFSNKGAVNEDMASKLKRRFLSAIGPDREPLVLGGGWEYEAMQIAPNESQFLETIKANRTMVAGFFKVPPGRIGAPAGDGMTYKNVEQDDLALMKFCAQPWVTRMETTLNQLTPRPEFVKLNMDSLQRPDLGTRYRAHDAAIRAGFKSVNEVRRVEDLPPIPDGDAYLWPPYRSQLTEDELGEPGEADAPAQRSARERITVTPVVHMPDVRVGAPVVHNHLPAPEITNHVNVPAQRSEAPTVEVHNHVDVPAVTVENTVPVPEVTVEAPDVTVSAPVTVKPDVRVEIPPRTRNIERDFHGNIIRVTEE